MVDAVGGSDIICDNILRKPDYLDQEGTMGQKRIFASVAILVI
jgi:hypothetical protein